MKNLLKKCFSILAMTSLLISQIYVSGLADDTTTSAAYTIKNDLDADGNWIYRELVPDIECETTNGFLKIGEKTSGSTMQDADIVLSNNNPHGGNYSIKRTMRTNPGIAFTPTAALKTYTQDEPNEYVISAWMRTECSDGQTVKVVPGYTIPAQTQFDKGTGESLSGFEVKNTWQYFSKKVRKGKSDAAKSVGFWFNGDTLTAVNAVYDTTGTESKYIQTLYIDDWSMRLCVPDSFPETERLSVDYNKEAQTLTYKFNLDIDPRTVRKENIDVNGVRGGTYIESAILKTTNEETREHTLTLKLQNLEKENIITVKLADIKDAWGRDVSGNAPFIINNYPEGQYTIYDDLDADGKWAYRNLISDEGCETLDGFWDKDKNEMQLSTDKHSGNYSLSRKMSGYAGLGSKVDDLELDAEYVLSVWAKADLHSAAGDTVNLTPAVSLYDDDGSTEAKYRETTFSLEIPINNEWGYYSNNNLKITKKTANFTITEIIKTKPMYVYFYANKVVNGEKLENTIYIDDWNFRKMPAWEVYLTGVYVDGNTATFTFDKDIDKWSVTADKILVNGAANSGKISDVKVTTDEITRETKLTVTTSEPISDKFVISLPDTAKDAWGRNIKNKFSTAFSIGKAQIVNSKNEVLTDVSSLKAGETYTYNLSDIVNGSEKAEEISAILALYDENGKCLKVGINSGKFEKGSVDGKISASVAVPEGKNNCVLKPFILNTKTLKPYDKPLKVLLIGNSYTSHAPDTTKGWIGNWGMAASSADKDYAHLLTSMLNKNSKNTEVLIRNISPIEKDFSKNGIDTNASMYYQDAIDFDADIIVATFGANIKDITWEDDAGYSNTSEFTKADYKNIIDKFNPNADAVVIAGDTIAAGSDLNNSKKAAIKGAAEDNGYIYVELDDIISSFPVEDEYKTNQEQYKNALSGEVNSGVLRHPGDTGMSYLANRIYVRGIINAFKKLGMSGINISEFEMP